MQVPICVHKTFVGDDIMSAGESTCSHDCRTANWSRYTGKENGEAFDITIYSDGDQIVNKYQSQYDIILMDVEMKFMDGMSAAEEIRKVDTEVIIIFITNMAQYAIRGYAVDALDYVLKPVSYFAFSQRLSRAIGRMKKERQR